MRTLTSTDIVYYFFYVVCLIFCFIKTNTIKGIFLLRAVLILGFVNEIFVEIMQHMGKEENFSHFIYIPLEYCLLCLFYVRQTKNKKLRLSVLISIPIYLIIAYIITVKFYSFESYPSIIYNIECIFSIVWLTLIMFNIDVIDSLSLTKVPLFWILSGLLIFYAGVYFFNAAYSFLLYDNKGVALNLRTYINLGLNIILYAFWIYAFICSARMKNYTYR